MATYANRYQVWCVTEDAWVFVDADVEPTECPNSAGHNIDENRTTARLYKELDRVSEGSSSTTLATWDDKLVWDTPALEGDYALHFYVEAQSAATSDEGQYRVQNITDGVTIAAGVISFVGQSLGGHIPLQFSGAKTFKVQWMADVGGKTMYCRRARLSLRKVG